MIVKRMLALSLTGFLLPYINAMASPINFHKSSNQTLPASYQADPFPVDYLVSFGDSLTDTDNLFQVLQEVVGEADPSILVKPLNAKIDRQQISDQAKRNVKKVVFTLAKEAVAALDTVVTVKPVPDHFYYKGRWSNGPLWTEWLGLSLLGKGVEDSERYINRAYGGSFAMTAKDQLMLDLSNPIQSILDLTDTLKLIFGGKLVPPDLRLLREAYQGEYPKAKPNTLYTIFYGANDYLTGEYAPLNGSVEKVTDSICRETEKLAEYFTGTTDESALGHIALVNMPDISRTPLFYKTKDVTKAEKLKEAITYHNQLLIQCAQKLSNLFPPRLHIHVADLRTHFDNVLNTKPDGINDHEACFTGKEFVDDGIEYLQKMLAKHWQSANKRDGETATHWKQRNRFMSETWPISTYTDMGNSEPEKCSKEDQYYFWDIVHPTRLMHALLSRKMCEELSTTYQMQCDVINTDNISDTTQWPKSANNP